MKPGKVSEAVYKRSILKRITNRTGNVCQEIGIGMDSSVCPPTGEGYPAMTAATVTMTKKNLGILGMQRASNRLAAVGAVGKTAWVSVIFPGWFMESHVKATMTELDDTAKELGIQITGVHAESVPEMEYPVMTVSLYGETIHSSLLTLRSVTAGMDIVMTKYAGTEGAAILGYERQEALQKRYTPAFLDRIQKPLGELSAAPEAAAAVKHGVTAMHTIEESGVFGALWEIAEAAGTGLEIDLKQIPIRQETIEVCELFDLNPYFIPSTGSMLLVAKDGYHLAAELGKEHIEARVIGRTTEGKDRLLWNEEEKRFMEPPKRSEIIKALMPEQNRLEDEKHEG